jgi:hypothetical protein
MNTEYHKGQIVGYVPIDQPIAVPLPRRWYILARIQATNSGS